MRILLVIWLFHSLAFADDVWQESTLNNYKHSINTRFERMNNNGSDKSKNICVAVEPTNKLKEKLTAKERANENTAEGAKNKRAYHREVHKQKVLCMSRYNNGREKIPMFSYFDGKKGYRVHCKVENGDFVCYNRLKKYRYHPTKHVVLADGEDLIARITRLKYRESSDDQKLFRLKTYYVSSRQKNFLPWHSTEQAEYQKIDEDSNNRKQTFKNIKNIRGETILPICRVSEGTVSDNSFAERVICHDGFNGREDYCRLSGTSKISLCKLTDRGILIKQDDDTILRVANCEYQPAAMHFYCSGKKFPEGPNKVYFERYGVNLAEEITNCPDVIDHRKKIHIERLKCTQKLINKKCPSFAGDIEHRCRRGKVRDEGCNFYQYLEIGQTCPTLKELLSSLGCRHEASYDDPCDFSYDTSPSTYSSGTTSQPREIITVPQTEVEDTDETVAPSDTRRGVEGS